MEKDREYILLKLISGEFVLSQCFTDVIIFDTLYIKFILFKS